MKTYIKSTRNDNDTYSSHEGMDLLVITSLLEAIGHSSIIPIDEQTFLDAVSK